MDTGDLNSNNTRAAPEYSSDSLFLLQEDVGITVPLLKITRFLKHVLPPLHPDLDARWEHIMNRLQEPHVDGYDAANKRWRAFPDSSPTSENKHSFNLASIATAVTDAVAHVFMDSEPPHQLMVFNVSLDYSPTSDWQNTHHCPDGYFVLREPARPNDERPHWMDMGPTGEYHLREWERGALDRTSKVLWNMRYSLRDDPRRRFVFAFSIEKEEMELWYANRAEVLVSERFSIMTSPEVLVRFFLAFLYGTPETAGWDPTMAYIEDSNPPQYRITVNDANGNKQVYKTLGLESSAEVLRGSGTRVWRAVRCDPKTFKVSKNTNEVALKDCWIDISQEPEGDIIRKVDKAATERIAALGKRLDDLQKTSTTPGDAVKALEKELKAAETLKACLPTLVTHGLVSSPESSELDRTLVGDIVLKDEDGSSVPWEYTFQDQKFVTTHGSLLDAFRSRLRGEHRPCHYLARDQDRIMHRSKRHYRLVYGEVCTSLYQAERLDLIFLHLARVTKALRGLHEAGWVHRDVSAGNILVTTGGDVRLSDWEYAKQICTETQDVRVGTVDFMAVEVEDGRHLFLPNRSTAHYNGFAPRPAVPSSSSAQRPLVPPPSTVSRPPWRYHPLHDIESILWLAKFFTENRDVVFISKQDGSQLDDKSLDTLGIARDTPEYPRSARLIAQYRRAQTLFHGADRRYHEFLVPRSTADRWYLHPALIKRPVFIDLDDMLSALRHVYFEVEAGLGADPPRLYTHDSYIYHTYDAALRTMAVTIQAIPAYVHVASLSNSVLQAQEADRAREVAPTNYEPPQAASTVPSMECDGLDNPDVKEETAAPVEKLQSVTIASSPAGLPRPASLMEACPGP